MTTDEDRAAWGLSAERGPYRGGRVHVLDDLCGTCIYRPGNLMRLRAGRVASMTAEAVERGSVVVCHSTLGTDVPAVCRGFFNGPGRRVVALRLAVACGVVQYDPVPVEEGL